ncbi:hypothetical protein L6452_45778 [Arctium lappa]|nr:hypothetical protein L6452_45778 [Arctium lappa]
MRPRSMWNGESRSANRLGAWTGAIGAAAKARAVDMPRGDASRRSWLAARAVTACLGTCVLPGTGLRAPHSARLETRTKESTSCPTQSEVGSSGWKSTARRAVSGAPPAALENPEDRVPPTPGRTHNRIRSPRAGHGGPSPEPVGCRRTARAASAARAGRRVPAGGRIGNGLFGGLPRASNSQLRTGTDKGNPTV